MNRDSRILIYGSFAIMLFIWASSFVCGCDRMLAATLQLIAYGFGAVGMTTAGAMEKWDLHSAA